MVSIAEPNRAVEGDGSEAERTPITAAATDEPEELDVPIGSFAEEEPVQATEADEDEGTAFDLFFLRISLVVDGILTMCAAFATERWHIYFGECPRSRDGDQTNALKLLVCFHSLQVLHLLLKEL